MRQNKERFCGDYKFVSKLSATDRLTFRFQCKDKIDKRAHLHALH